MTKRTPLSAESAALVMVGLGTIALMGVPGFGHRESPVGAVQGLVLDTRGSGLMNAEVALFDHELAMLVEVTRTDAEGRFAFSQAPERFDVFASRPEEPERIGAWALDRARDPEQGLELYLREGTPLDVTVTDEEGLGLTAAEVRVLDASGPDPVTVSRSLTDETGRVTVVLPPAAHLVVLPPAAHDRLAPTWVLDATERPREGGLALQLDVARALEGRVTDASRTPRGGLCVSAWDSETEEWLGWTATDDEGRWSLPLAADAARLRIADPTGSLLAFETTAAPSETPLDVVLGSGRVRDLRVGTPEDPLPARVWMRDEASGTWSWGRPTRADGSLELAVTSAFSVVAVPRSAPTAPLSAWNLAEGTGSLQLSRPTTETEP